LTTLEVWLRGGGKVGIGADGYLVKWTMLEVVDPVNRS